LDAFQAENANAEESETKQNDWLGCLLVNSWQEGPGSISADTNHQAVLMKHVSHKLSLIGQELPNKF
jgi:hypothetical protein